MMMNTHTFSFLSAESTALMPLFLSNIIGAKNTLKNYNVDLMQIKGPVPGIVGLVAYSKAEVENISPYSLPSFKGCVEIKSLMVSPGCEKKGYGTNLINRVLNQTSKDVCINIKNQDQIPFFKKKGFEIAVGMGNTKLVDLLKDSKPDTDIILNYLYFAMMNNKGLVIG